MMVERGQAEERGADWNEYEVEVILQQLQYQTTAATKKFMLGWKA